MNDENSVIVFKSSISFRFSNIAFIIKQNSFIIWNWVLSPILLVFRDQLSFVNRKVLIIICCLCICYIWFCYHIYYLWIFIIIRWKTWNHFTHHLHFRISKQYLFSVTHTGCSKGAKHLDNEYSYALQPSVIGFPDRLNSR